MDKVQFKVAIASGTPTALGADLIAYYFSPNPGELLQPLAATASGGEMSRFLLALKACFSQVDTAGTLIFDEIDAGVSGRVAQAIADKLHQLSQHHQVLCITHQPLVAAMADYHFRVDKQVINASSKNGDHESGDLTQNSKLKTQNSLADVRTVVRVSFLDNHLHRQEELAQLAGGKSAQEAMAFAESLLTQAAHRRQN
jgi:DNA repair protein RecN (Recombination protein N)